VTTRPWRLLGGAAGALTLAVLAVSCSGPLNSAPTGVGCSVTVSIPASGSRLLGKVEARYDGHSSVLIRNTNTLMLACGQTARLTAEAVSPSAHPFASWNLNGRHTTQATVTVTADGLVTVAPSFYVAPKPSPVASPSPSASPSATPSTVVLDKWLTYDGATKTATLKLEAGIIGINNSMNFDGYSTGALDVTVPVGWTVVVNFSNVDSVNHSAAVVPPTGTTLVFAGASIPNPTVGLPPGSKATFSFVAATAGNYRIACLMPGHEALGMWATFDVTSGGLPTIHV
jgi:plastocyanin